LLEEILHYFNLNDNHVKPNIKKAYKKNLKNLVVARIKNNLNLKFTIPAIVHTGANGKGAIADKNIKSPPNFFSCKDCSWNLLFIHF